MVRGRPRRLRVEWRPRWGRRRRRRGWDAVRRWRYRVHGGRSRVPRASTDRWHPVLDPGHVRLWSEPLLRRGIRVHWWQVAAGRRWVCLHRRPDGCFGHGARCHERRWLRRRRSVPNLLHDGRGLRSVPAKEFRRVRLHGWGLSVLGLMEGKRQMTFWRLWTYAALAVAAGACGSGGTVAGSPDGSADGS